MKVTGKIKIEKIDRTNISLRSSGLKINAKSHKQNRISVSI